MQACMVYCGSTGYCIRQPVSLLFHHSGIRKRGGSNKETTSLHGCSVASEAYHDWSGEAAGARLRVNFTLKLLLSQNFCNQPLMRFISFASNIGPAAAVPAGPAPAPLLFYTISL